jgi:hypothetical protein
MKEPIVLQGCPAYLAAVLGPYEVDAWLSDDAWRDYDPKRAVRLHLDQTPGRARDAAEVEVDDHLGAERWPGYTTFGPSFPGAARSEGAVYLEERRYRAGVADGTITRDPKLERWAQVRVHRGDDGSVTRYYGFAATVEHADDRQARFTVSDVAGHRATLSVDRAAPPWDETAPPESFTPGAQVRLFLPTKLHQGLGIVPVKIPLGLGAGPVISEPSSSRDPRAESPMTGPWINVCGRAHDDTLAEIQAGLTGRWTAGGWHAWARLLRRLADAPDGTDRVTLDLVAHSSAVQHVLVIGDWHVGLYADTTAELAAALAEIRAALPRRLAQVRLIGCSTASTAKGARAMRWLTDLLGVPCVGTARAVGSRDFVGGRYIGETVGDMRVGEPVRLPAGAVADGARVELDTLVRRPPRASRVAIADPGGEVVRGWADLTRVARVPGLLTVPLIELDVVAGDRALPIDVLFDYELLRLYPTGEPDGVLVPIRDDARAALRAIVAAADVVDEA